jgi:hypothetical protein
MSSLLQVGHGQDRQERLGLALGRDDGAEGQAVRIEAVPRRPI